MPEPPVKSADRPRVATLAVVALLVLGLVASGCGRSAPAAVAPPPSGGAPSTAFDAPQVHEGGQVTVAVRWAGPDAGLVFQVAMDTHSVNLDGYDLKALAVLRTDAGVELRPSGWDAPPGGHHRSGTLTFPAQTPDGKPVLAPGVGGLTLILRDIAGVPERTFQWTW